MSQPGILLSTVGTSLFQPNLNGLKIQLADGSIENVHRPLAEAYCARDWETVAARLADLSPTDRLCGAEINSVTSLVEGSHVAVDCGLFFLHSATPDGRAIAEVLVRYYRERGHAPVEAVEIADLQDEDPKRFCTRGLRNMARSVCRVVHERSAAACAINATGGYKAQIAIAVLLGQSLGVPVYYKHERFSGIVAFPPMPVALDSELWQRASGLLYSLATKDVVPAEEYADEWDEKYETLVEREEIDGRSYLTLSPTGQIFHDTIRQRFRSSSVAVLPPAVPASQKKAPRLEKSGWTGTHPEVEAFMRRVTDEVPQVRHCYTYYYNPDLSAETRFRLGSKGIEGIFARSGYCVKFGIDTAAQTPTQQSAVVAALNEWLVTTR